MNTNNEIVNNDASGTTWTGAAKLTPNGAQPAYNFDIVSTTNPEVFTFKVKSTFTNSMTWLSPSITMTVFCNNNYNILASGGGPIPTLIAHAPITDGFILPTYAHA